MRLRTVLPVALVAAVVVAPTAEAKPSKPLPRTCVKRLVGFDDAGKPRHRRACPAPRRHAVKPVPVSFDDAP